MTGGFGLASILTALGATTILSLSSSRTESFIIAPQLGQIDKVGARFLLQTGQFIVFKRFIGLKCFLSEIMETQ
jgi:hypothetical protein